LTNQRSPRRTSSARRLIAAPLHSVGYRQEAHCHDYCPRSSSYVTAAQPVVAALLASAMGNTSRRADQGRDCGAAEIQRIAENAPRWPDRARV